MRKYLIFLLSLFVIVACSEFDNLGHDPLHGGKLDFGANAAFLRLQDDSTQIASILEITGDASVKIKWNVDPEFNLDTTVTELALKNGRGQLPIKWNSRLPDGNYGPVLSAYCGGVLITSGNNSRYVPLIWADEVDSVKVMESLQNIETRSGETVMPMASKLTLTNNPLALDKDTCGTFRFGADNTGRVYIDWTDMAGLPEFDSYNLNLAILPPQVSAASGGLPLEWTDKGAPELDFLGHLSLENSGYRKYAYFSYTQPGEPEPKVWNFKRCMPDSLLLASDTTVVVIVETNRPWSLKWRIEGTTEEGSINSQEGSSGEQALLAGISKNNGPDMRVILVDVYSEAVLDTTIILKQFSAENFVINSISPEVSKTLKAQGENVTVQVTTTEDWWISYGGTRYNFLASHKEGSVTIPENPNPTTREIVITVGYGTTLVETYVYTQNFGDELHFDGSNLLGTIPVDGASYIFNFSGSYVGTLQVRAVLDNKLDSLIAVSPATSGKDVTLAVPNNYTSLQKRTLRFQYKKTAGDWVDLEKPEGVLVKAEQDGATISPEVLPTAPILRDGGTSSGVFSGTYRGKILMKAEGPDMTTEPGEGTCPGTINLIIPALTGLVDRVIEFSYSADGGATWKTMGKRTQIAGTLIVGSITPDDTTIPAEGKAYSCSFTGTYPGMIIFQARTGDKVFNPQSGTAPVTMTVQVPKNEDENQRDVVFEYSKDNGTTWIPITTKPQTSNIKIEGGGNTTGGFEDKDNVTGGGEL